MANADADSNPKIDHERFMRIALDEAKKSPPKPTNFCVGACLVSISTSLEPLITGYTLECEGNTHAEQCCFIKLAAKYGCSPEKLGLHLPNDTILYTTMEPCNRRSVGNLPCVDRILQLKRKDGTPAISTVYAGVKEPETFVGENTGSSRLKDGGVFVEHIPGLEDEILKVATAGHAENAK